MTRAARLTLFLLALAVFGSAFLHFRSELIDDAYISLRYARHLAHGEGLVWNPGEAVEGYTDFFWVLLLSLTGATPGAALVMGAACGALLLAALAFPPPGFRNLGAAGAILPLTVAANLAVPFWAAKGLETSLFTLFLTTGLLAHASARLDGNSSRSLLGVHLLALSALARPEGILFLGLALFDKAWQRRDRAFAAALLVAAVALVPHFAFRLTYYGYPLPNTYYAKVGFGLDQFARGARYVAEFFSLPGFVLFAAAGLGAWGPGDGHDGSPERAAAGSHRFLAAALLVGLLAIVYVGGDAFGAYRFLVPLVPILNLLSIAGFVRLGGWLATRFGGDTEAMIRDRANGAKPGPRQILTGLVPGALAVLLALSSFVATRAPVEAEEREVRRFTALMIEVGRALKVGTPPSFTIALNPAGAVPYYSERRTIDMLGLNDLHIAHSPAHRMGKRTAGHEKGDGAYVLSRRPELILIGNVWVDEQESVSTMLPSRRSEIEIARDPKTYEQYRLARIDLPGGSRTLKALLRKDLADAPAQYWGPVGFDRIPKPKPE